MEQYRTSCLPEYLTIHLLNLDFLSKLIDIDKDPPNLWVDSFTLGEKVVNCAFMKTLNSAFDVCLVFPLVTILRNFLGVTVRFDFLFLSLSVFNSKKIGIIIISIPARGVEINSFFGVVENDQHFGVTFNTNWS